jgi:serine/threonine protein phosphatase 1
MPGRTIAIGDIHGCLAALDAVLAGIEPRPDDTLVTLGDYIDRGPHSREVIERLLRLKDECRLVPLLGNHDQMLLLICEGMPELISDWRLFGGDATRASYGGPVPGCIPPEHLDFLRNCRLFHETEHHIFVHGNYLPNLPLEEQLPTVLLWDSLRRRQPGPHRSGKTAIIGHTAQKDGKILDLDHLKCIDTWCYGEGWLTALEVHTGQVWQADKSGQPPSSKLRLPSGTASDASDGLR